MKEMTVERMQRAFSLYRQVCNREIHIKQSRPKGSFGIAIDEDNMAIKWQQTVAWRKEVLDAALTGRQPNPYRKPWYKMKKETP